MKKVLFVITALLIATSLQASIPEVRTPTYQPILEAGERLFIPMEFGKSSFSLSEELKQLDPSTILKVEIVCTDYPHGINLNRLNEKRLKALSTAKPKMELSTIFTQVVRQMDCPEELDARRLFHGLVITYRPKPTPESMEQEWEKLESLLRGEIPTAPIDYVPSASTVSDELDVAESSTSLVESEEKIMSPIRKALIEDLMSSLPKDAILDTSGTNITITHGASYTIYHMDGLTAYPSLEGPTNYRTDSTIQKIMHRHPDWSNMLIAADLTGSMYPYAAQILTWLQLNSNDERVKSFVFFNDGNWTPDDKKVIGKTGGIYQGNYSSYPDVKALAQETMSNGGGGDCPENNIEALIEGLKGEGGYQEVILIADSWAPVKDISLLDQIKQPVRVVVCGSWGGAHPDYLKIARETGGSIHTMEEDLENLIKLNEGETVELGGFTYRLEKGKFVKVTRS